MTSLRQGMVTGVGPGTAWVLCDDVTTACILRGNLKASAKSLASPVVVGDEVLFRARPTGAPVVESVLDRQSILSRGAVRDDGYRAEQIIAANMDQVAVVASTCDPPFKTGFIDRLLVSAYLGGVKPLLIVNKIDLKAIDSLPEAGVYRKIGIQVLSTCALSGEGIEALRLELKGAKTVMCGFSGSGKTSLLNRLAPGINLRTGLVISRTGKGRHTTSKAELIRIPDVGWVADTPGVREWRIVGVAPEDLPSAFPEIESLAGNCRFADCRHAAEPDCPVKQAAAQGGIAQSRYKSYLKLLKELA